MTELVQVAIAGDVTEAEVIQGLLDGAGIPAVLEPAEDEVGTNRDHVRVLVAEGEVESARDAIEALSEPEDQLAE